MNRRREYKRHSAKVTRGPRWKALRMRRSTATAGNASGAANGGGLRWIISSRCGIALTWPIRWPICNASAGAVIQGKPELRSAWGRSIPRVKRGKSWSEKRAKILSSMKGKKMLDSVKIARRQSEIRQTLSEIVGKETPSEDETRKMDELDREYRSNETRYRAALVAEDTERREAGADLETRSERQWTEVMAGFELRQVALALEEGRALEGQTQEIVTELRSRGGYRAVPVPWEALETRAGETLAAGTPNPLRTAPIIERLFAGSVAARMGGQMVNVGVGEVEYPVATSAVTAGWAASETGNVTGPSAYTTVDRPLKPDHNLGVQMRITRKTLKQSGTGLEQAVRRDMNGAIEEALDAAVFLGSGSAGEPTGLFAGASAWDIEETPVSAVATWAAIRSEVVGFITGNAATGPGAVRGLFRPEVWDSMDDTVWDAGSGITEWDRMAGKLGATVLSHNALEAPTGDPAASKAVLTTNAGGVAPFFVGTWGAIDLVRDIFSDAQSGGLRLTALATMDVTISRAVQTRILTGIQ